MPPAGSATHARSPAVAGEPPAPGAEPVAPSPWRYLPHALAATALVVGIPSAAAIVVPAGAGLRSHLLSAALAIALAPVVATAGAAVWERRRAARDILFGDLMLWGFVRRIRTERRLAAASRLLGLDRRGAPKGLRPAQRVAVLESLAGALEARDAYTHGHSRRVARHAHEIAKRLGLPDEQVARVRTAAALHDVGKLGTPREILNKRGALTDEEFAVIKRHPVEGADLIAAIDDPEVVAMVRQHHERLDGSGYPDGLRDSQITVGARIIAVADTFDALTSARPYRTPRKQRLALEVLRQEAGVRLDAHAVAAFRSYESGRRTATWSTLLVTVPDRIFAPLLWGAAPVAKTAAAAGAAVALGGSLMDMGPVGNAGAPATGARLAGGANSSVVDVRTSHRAAAGRDDDRKARDRREARSEVEGGRRPRADTPAGRKKALAPGASAGQSPAPGNAANLGGAVVQATGLDLASTRGRAGAALGEVSKAAEAVTRDTPADNAGAVDPATVTEAARDVERAADGVVDSTDKVPVVQDARETTGRLGGKEPGPPGG